MADVRLFVTFYRRAMPRFLQVKAWIDSGAIGKVRLTRAVPRQCGQRCALHPGGR